MNLDPPLAGPASGVTAADLEKVQLVLFDLKRRMRTTMKMMGESVPPWIVEASVLSARTMLEDLVMLSFAAHANFAESLSKQLLNKQPASLLKTLEQWNPSFWPIPVTVTVDGATALVDDSEPAQFTPTQWGRWHGKLSTHLHAPNPHKERPSLADIAQELEDLLSGIGKLTDNFIIELVEGRAVVFCQINYDDAPYTPRATLYET